MTNLEASGGSLTEYGKKQLSAVWYDRGKSFVGAAFLLRKQCGDQYVVLHLMCQGIEVILKALLLAKSYDTYQPRLRRPIGHNLVKLADEAMNAFGMNNLNPKLREELANINNFYAQHLLRYGSAVDFLIDPHTIEYDRLGKSLVTIIKIGDKFVKKQIAS